MTVRTSRERSLLAALFAAVAVLVFSILGDGPSGLASASGATGPAAAINTAAGSVCSPAQAKAMAVQPYALAADGAGGFYVADAGHSVVCHVTASGQATTAAGNGAAGWLGDGMAATATELYTPSGVAVDGSGNLYIADRWNQRVRKVTAATGIISTVAGNGVEGYAGDGGPATAAQLDFPTGVAVDSSGHLYITDSKSNHLRVVNLSTGTISTAAGNGTAGYAGDGGPATAATLNFPTGVAVDSSGNVAVADTNNNRVRKIAAKNGVISTQAGTGAGGFSGDGGPATKAALFQPQGVAFKAHDLYIADTVNNRIRLVSGSTISTVVGNGQAAFAGDGGAAKSASVNYPMGVATAASGTILVADSANNRVRSVTSGVITTVGGNGTPNYSGDGGPAVTAEIKQPLGVGAGPDGSAYVADSGNGIVRRIDTAGTITTVAGTPSVAGYGGDGGPATAARLNFPTAVAVDGFGNLYIVDRGNNRVRKVTPSGTISTIAGTGAAGYSGDGGPAASAALNAPATVTVDGLGDVYIADAGNNRVRVVNPLGLISTIAGTGAAGYSGDGGPAIAAALSSPYQLAFGPTGTLYIADRNNQRVRAVAATGIITTVAGNGRIGYSGEGVAATASALNYPDGVAINAAGNLFIADTGNCLIQEVNLSAGSSATIVTVAGWTPVKGLYPVCGYAGDGGSPTGGGTRLYSPTSVFFEPNGALDVADSLNHRVRRITGLS